MFLNTFSAACRKFCFVAGFVVCCAFGLGAQAQTIGMEVIREMVVVVSTSPLDRRPRDAALARPMTREAVDYLIAGFKVAGLRIARVSPATADLTGGLDGGSDRILIAMSADMDKILPPLMARNPVVHLNTFTNSVTFAGPVAFTKKGRRLIEGKVPYPVDSGPMLALLVDGTPRKGQLGTLYHSPEADAGLARFLTNAAGLRYSSGAAMKDLTQNALRAPGSALMINAEELSVAAVANLVAANPGLAAYVAIFEADFIEMTLGR